jgi:hypothetical protein
MALLFMLATSMVNAQYTYTTNNGGITITKYTGSSGAVAIPSTISDLPVTTIGYCAFQRTSPTDILISTNVTYIMDKAFDSCRNLTNITIPGSVTCIGYEAFANCTSLAEVTIPDSITSIPYGAFYYCTNLTRVIIPSGVTTIGGSAFQQTSLTDITIPSNVACIQRQAFFDCARLKGVYFTGNVPIAVGDCVFYHSLTVTVYYPPGATGRGGAFEGRPAVLWNPLIYSIGAGFGVEGNSVGFNVTGTRNIPIVVEACTNMVNSKWSSLQSATLGNGIFYFRDPDWTNYPTRFYRICTP